MKLFSILLCSLTLFGCHSVPSKTETSQSNYFVRLPRIKGLVDSPGILQGVNTTDGISFHEADLIREYYDSNIGCGGLSSPTDGGPSWIINGAFGVAGKPIQFLIDKKTGIVTVSKSAL